jgi:hypothetical protein
MCPDGSFFVSQQEPPCICKVALDGSVQRVAGSLSPGRADGPAAEATFSSPGPLALGRDDSLFIAEKCSEGREGVTVRCLSPEGRVSTVAALPKRLLRFPRSMAAAADGRLFLAGVAENCGGILVCISPAGEVSSCSPPLVRGEEALQADFAVTRCSHIRAGLAGWHPPVALAPFQPLVVQQQGSMSFPDEASISGLAVSPEGCLFFCDCGDAFNGRVYCISADGASMTQLKEEFRDPFQLALGPDGSLFVLETDLDCGRVMKVV